MKKRKKLLLNEDKGFVELYLSVDEVLSLLEVLAFTRKLCNSFIAQPLESVSDETKHLLQDKMLASSLLEEKIRADVDPGQPDGPLH